MSRTLKFLLALLVVVILVVAGLTVAVKLMLSPERLIPVVEREAGKALGRQVKVGNLDVGLFSGIEVQAVSIKEKDPSKTFAKVKLFRLRYDLWALLHKKLLIKSVELVGPEVSITRKKGRFNYESLAILAPAAGVASGGGGQGGKKDVQGGGIPISIAVERLSVREGRFHFLDEDGELPEVTADLGLTATLGLQGEGGVGVDSRFQLGLEARPQAKAAKGKAEPVKLGLKGRMTMRGKLLSLKTAIQAAGQVCNLDLTADLSGPGPKVEAVLSGQEVDVEPLLALAGAFSSPEKGSGNAKKGGKVAKAPSKQAPLAELLPQGLLAVAEIRFDGVKYQGFKARDVDLKAKIEAGKAAMTGAAKVIGGTVGFVGDADLNQKVMPFNGGLDVKGVDPGEALSAMGRLPYIQGRGDIVLKCQGRGVEWEVIREELQCDGLYSLKSGRIYSNGVTKAIGGLLGLQELISPSFDELGGNLKIREGKVVASLKMDAMEYGAQGQGAVGLDGSLDFPITLLLSKKMAEKAAARLPLINRLPEQDGRKAIPLVVKGSVTAPKVTISAKGAKEAAKKAVGREIQRQLQRHLDKGAANATKGGAKDQGGQADQLHQMFNGLMGGNKGK